MADNIFSGLAAGLAAGQSIRANRQNRELQQQQMDMQKQELDMKKQAFDVDRKKAQLDLQDRQKASEMKQGLNEAFSSGGYEGAMDYLKHTDMQTYMNISKGKADMDKSIADANTAKYSTDKERLAATDAAHTILGKFGATILKAPENDRPQMYQDMLPVLKKIYPDMPSAYDDHASNIFMVSMGASMPESMLYGADKKAARAQTTIGKLYADIQNLRDRGATDDDPAMKSLQAQLTNEEKNSTAAQLDAAKNAKGEDDLSKRYVDLNKGFMDVRDMYANIKDYSDSKASAAGDMKLINSYQRMIDPGSSVKEGEYATVKNAGSWSARMRANYNSAIDGKLLSPQQRDDFLKQASQIYQAKEQFYNTSKSEFTRIAVERGLDPSKVVIDLGFGDGSSPTNAAPPSDWAQKVKALNPGYSDADVAAAWQYSQKQKSSQPNIMTPQMDSQDANAPQAAQQPPQQANVPPWVANNQGMGGLQ